MLEEAFTFALRDGDWKYIHPQEKDTPPWLDNKVVANGLSDQVQLYNLESDPAERKNLASEYPDVVEKMSHQLAAIRNNGYSRPR